LFDVHFGNSAKAGSEFGWEDVEMGYRLYSHAAVIRFTDRALSVRVSHEPSTVESATIERSFRNFDRLFAKHPDMELAARRWAVDTYGKMQDWAATAKVDAGEPQRSLEARFEAAAQEQEPLTKSYRPGERRLRILTYRWHVPHQYELYKLPHDFTLATQIGENVMVNAWGYDQRPMRPNVRLTPAREIDPRDFDLAVLHFDENLLSPNLCNNVIPSCWGEALDWLIAQSDLPKVAICHGTPQFVGQYALNPAQLTSFDVHEDERLRLVRHFADAAVKVVCNSWQALEEWGFEDSRVIWHGFDPQEFPGGTQMRDILALGQDRNRPHYRGAWEHAVIRERLDSKLKIETAAHEGASLDPRGTNAFAVRNFRSYVDRIRMFTAYLNTTLRSPMPRSRGEAMMTGVIPVALANHDVERFIDQGKNGFYSSDPLELADWLNHLFRHRREARRIAAAARRTAMDVFNHDRYLTSWTKLIEDAIGERTTR
jgi:glycosyltransferase involved in cell wall biosynthesis